MSPPSIEPVNHYTTAVPDGMIKGGITQMGMAQRIAYSYSHIVSFILSSFVEVSSFILSNNHALIHKRYLSLITMYVNLHYLHVDWKSLGPFNLWRLIQILSWILLLAVVSVEIAPFEELYKYDCKTGKLVAGSIPLHTTIYQTLFVCLQTTFLL